QVLSFDAFSSEEVVESRDEAFRVHRCKILYFLEDDTMQICEPKQDNSGMVQGWIILKRHRIAKPNTNNNNTNNNNNNNQYYYTMDDLNIGVELNIYNTIYTICNCDPYTRDYLQRSGQKVNAPLEIPLDSFALRKISNLQTTSAGQQQRNEKFKLKQQLESGNRILRFFCYWDDRESVFGDERLMVMNYYLADDTIEVIENHAENCGRDSVGTFLKRSKLPKNPDAVIKQLPDSDSKYYKDSDFMIGSYVNVWGRSFLICDYDGFTRHYYKTKYGIENFTPITLKKPSVDPANTNNLSIKQAPPYNGFGGHEDSLNSALSLIPKPPKSDFIRFFLNDRQGMNGNVLRFAARIPQNNIDSDREFVVSFFLADDKMMVFERTFKNSGLQAGKFLEKSKVMKPGYKQRYLNKLPDYYELTDMKVGHRILVNGLWLLLHDADDYTYKYMFQHPEMVC
ncbi:hypothetical protein HELRODRAFT_83504, partial [Helobdella robusta]|uniref:DM10 domain-containing protein n=1 Tax=Helobdella robusta TaxID=6412 RepID=T1G564_HELRO